MMDGMVATKRDDRLIVAIIFTSSPDMKELKKKLTL